MKAWYLSKTMWGGIIASVLGAASIGVQIDFVTGDFHGNVYELLTNFGGVFGGLLAIYGRTVAKLPLK